MSSILCIDDEPSIGVILERSLVRLGHEPVLANSVEEGMQAVRRQPFDLIIADYQMPKATGHDLLDLLREQGVHIPVIILTGYSSIEHAVQSIRQGAADYLTKPIRIETLRIAVNNAIELARLRRENDDFRREIIGLRGSRAIVGASAALTRVMETIATVAPTRATVLLEGESGTGKELFARAIHECSPRKDKPFITLNCAAMPEGLVESGLFGHEKGAFTGATTRASGAFERANGGTLMLDEISEMRLDLQAKLLRVIQEQEFERVGGHQSIRVDVRLIATTNRELAAEVEAGRFRRDLYYRLNVVPIRTPSLRERPEDIPLLVDHFVEQAALQIGVKPPPVVPEVYESLKRRRWAGNVRELANACERAVILGRAGTLSLSSFGLGPEPSPPAARAADQPLTLASVSGGLPMPETTFNLKQLEERTIQQALAATGGHRTRAAQLLGISERTLRNKLNPPSHAEGA